MDYDTEGGWFSNDCPEPKIADYAPAPMVFGWSGFEPEERRSSISLDTLPLIKEAVILS